MPGTESLWGGMMSLRVDIFDRVFQVLPPFLWCWESNPGPCAPKARALLETRALLAEAEWVSGTLLSPTWGDSGSVRGNTFPLTSSGRAACRASEP